MTIRRFRFAVLPLLLLTGQPAFAGPQVDASLFERPAVLEPNVAFWREVFGKYSRHQVVIHAQDYPNKAFTVLDYRAEAAAGMDGAELTRRRREDVRRTIARIDALLERIAAQNGSADGLGDEARAIHALFADLNDPGVYRRIKGRIRAQPGVAERTREGLERAGRYLPYMEQTFAEAGLPVALTRLPLVESSFDTTARSSAQAAGIWQFMPATARVYMRLDHVVDQRNDPWLSTHAAARHLADDYAMLQDWPLAVTAYNFGRYGMRRALERVGGHSLSDLVERYDGRRFGFASRNFYASFLAALDVEQNREQWFGPLSPQPPVRFDTVETRHYVAWNTLQRLSGWNAQEFARHNPSYGALVRDGQLLVPPGSIRVAPGHGAAFERSYVALASTELQARQRDIFLAHRVAPGETLSHVARRYNTSARHLQQLNGISNPNRVRAGQSLRVPAPGMSGTAVAAAAQSASTVPTAASAPVRTHVVASGETLSGIARRYGTSVARLQAANGLSNAHRVRAGQRLQVPGSGAVEHTVQRGETLWHIARRYGVSVAQLQSANSLDSSHLRPGQRLRIPVSGQSA